MKWPQVAAVSVNQWRCYVGTGYVCFDEFCTIVRKKIGDDEEEREMRDMFRILDKEKRGEVNTEELRYNTSLSYGIRLKEISFELAVVESFAFTARIQ